MGCGTHGRTPPALRLFACGRRKNGTAAATLPLNRSGVLRSKRGRHVRVPAALPRPRLRDPRRADAGPTGAAAARTGPGRRPDAVVAATRSTFGAPDGGAAAPSGARRPLRD